MIDLRSDTVTRPSPGMRKAMAEADVGDDVFGEDPTVNGLEAEVAVLAGKQAALFVSSGTMGNQLAVACQTRPGDEIIVGEGAHLVWNECSALAALSGVQYAIAGSGGLFTADEMEERIKPGTYYYPRTALVAVENTHNRAGGRVFPPEDARVIAERARRLGLAAHLDGARIWNASVATRRSVAELCEPFDTVSMCFSKGLGAPVGSALIGSRVVIERARRFRKMWGGGTRQAGILAAAARYALANNRARLAEDHEHARLFARVLAKAPHIQVDPEKVETSIVNVDLAPPILAEDVARVARELGLAINASGVHRLRAIMHLDVVRGDVEKAARILADAVQRTATTKP